MEANIYWVCQKREKQKKVWLNSVSFNFEIFSKISSDGKHSNDSFVHLSNQIISLSYDRI